jgi:hypothetical protein
MDLSKGSQRREELAGIYENDAFENELAASTLEINDPHEIQIRSSCHKKH